MGSRRAFGSRLSSDDQVGKSDDSASLRNAIPATLLRRRSRREAGEISLHTSSMFKSFSKTLDDGKLPQQQEKNRKQEKAFAELHELYRDICEDPCSDTERPNSPAHGPPLRRRLERCVVPASGATFPPNSPALSSPLSQESMRCAPAAGSTSPPNSPTRGSPLTMQTEKCLISCPTILPAAPLTSHREPPRASHTQPTLTVGGELLRTDRSSRNAGDSPPAHTTQFLKGFRLQVDRAASPRAMGKQRSTFYAQGTDLYPEVEITIKVYNVSSFELRDQRFYADFVLMCDWIDPQLIGLDPKTVNFEDLFCPEIIVHNALSDFESIPDSSGKPSSIKLFDSDIGWVKWTQRFRGGLSTGELNCTTYPFESQALPIVLKAKKMNGDFLTLVHPRLRRLYDQQFEHGHVVDTGGSQLTEYTLTGITGLEPRHKGFREERTDSYEVKIIVKRHWDNVVWNILFPMFLLTMLSFVVYFIDIKDLPNRFQVTLTLLLTVIAFKLSTRELLPAVSYLTVMDHYIIHSILIFWSNGWEHAIVTHLNLTMGHEVARAVEITWLSFTIMGSFLCHLWLLWNWWIGSRDLVNPLDVLGTTTLSSGWFRRKKKLRPTCFLSHPPEVVTNVPANRRLLAKSMTKAKFS
eukprot:GEMP01005912.1.p1 GENE.GEMP01005912.1~~GEMP01005912.1.p1  ORF type:complete len:636 (+),score=116.63 GEMP01005912.1:88-1995(+)